MRLEDLVREIAEDSSSGAAQLTIRAANVFLKLLDARPSIRKVEKLAKILAESRPSMPSIANMAFRILRLTEEQVSRGEKIRDAVEAAVGSAVKSYQNDLKRTVQNSSKLLKKFDSILVHSYSSTVAAAIELAGNLKVFVTESRPGYEGRRLAERLAQRGFEVTLIVDSAAAYVIDRGVVDAIVTGCDAILDDCSIANKIGTKMIALAGRDAGVPLYVLTDLWKTAVYGFSFEEHPPGEVYGKASGNLSALNPYFEVVSSKLIKAFVTEEGAFKPRDLGKKLHEVWGQISGPYGEPMAARSRFR